MFQLTRRGPGVVVTLGILLGRCPRWRRPLPPGRMNLLHSVQAATQAALMEIEAGKLAMNASTNSDVKTFADRMITDHGRASGGARGDRQEEELQCSHRH